MTSDSQEARLRTTSDLAQGCGRLRVRFFPAGYSTHAAQRLGGGHWAQRVRSGSPMPRGGDARTWPSPAAPASPAPCRADCGSRAPRRCPGPKEARSGGRSLVGQSPRRRLLTMRIWVLMSRYGMARVPARSHLPPAAGVPLLRLGPRAVPMPGAATARGQSGARGGDARRSRSRPPLLGDSGLGPRSSRQERGVRAAALAGTGGGGPGGGVESAD